MAPPHHRVLDVDGLQLYHQRPSAGRQLHRDAEVPHQGLDRVLGPACCWRCPSWPYSSTTAGTSLGHRSSRARAPRTCSASTIGGSSKAIFYIGLWLVLLGILSVLIRLVASFSAGAHRRSRPADRSRRARGLRGRHAGVVHRLSRPHHVLPDVLHHLLRLSGRIRDGRHGARFRLHRLAARRVPDQQPVQRAAAHVGRRGRRPRPRLGADVHFHGLDPRAVGLGQGHAARRPRFC